MVEHGPQHPAPDQPDEGPAEPDKGSDRPDEGLDRPDEGTEHAGEASAGEAAVGEAAVGEDARDEPLPTTEGAEPEPELTESGPPHAGEPAPGRSHPQRHAVHRYVDQRDSQPTGADRPPTNERELSETTADRTASDRSDLHRTPPGRSSGRAGHPVGDGAEPLRATEQEIGAARAEQPPAWVGSPPAQPPVGADPLIWRLAYGLHLDHSAHTDAFCVACKNYWPCEWRLLAEHAFVQAFRRAQERRSNEPPGADGSAV